MMQYNTTEMNLVNQESILLEKWKGLLVPDNAPDLPRLESKKKALITAKLLENQQNHMRSRPQVYGNVEILQEAISAGGQNGVMTSYGNADPQAPWNNGGSAEDYRPNAGEFGNAVHPTNNDFYARGDARIPNQIMPMVRRVYPELLANEIVGIQPMSGPVGMAFALRMKYDNENLAQFTPDGGSTLNPDPNVAQPWRSNGQEAGYNYLNTAHTGTTSKDLVGNECFEFVAEDQGVADLLKNCECNTAIPQMSLCIEKTAVEAGCRKLAVKFSQESEEDLMAMHGISVRDEMISTMSYELQAEIDREILMRMLQIALKAPEGRGWSVWSPASADGRWSQERTINLYQHVIIQARLIETRNRRGPANFAVATPYALAMLESLGDYFKPNCCSTGTNGVKEVAGSVHAGTMAGIKIYADSRTEAQYQSGIRGSRVDYILLGYKGRESHDTGLVYLPYIPIMIAETRGAHDFDPRIGIRTRYALATHLHGAENFYHVIVLKGLTDCVSDGDCKKMLW